MTANPVSLALDTYGLLEVAKTHTLEQCKRWPEVELAMKAAGLTMQDFEEWHETIRRHNS